MCNLYDPQSDGRVKVLFKKGNFIFASPVFMHSFSEFLSETSIQVNIIPVGHLGSRRTHLCLSVLFGHLSLYDSACFQKSSQMTAIKGAVSPETSGGQCGHHPIQSSSQA